MTKWMWIIAGPNGAGKTSFAKEFLPTLGIPDIARLNADERTLELRSQFPADKPPHEINLLAAQQIDAEVIKNIEEGKSFFVETVLSSDKYRDDVLEAKKRGYQIGLVYISLHPPELSPERIGVRVAKGGHNIEAAKAIDRYHRSHKQLRWFAKQANTFMAFDNSSAEAKPVLIAAKLAGKNLVHRTKDINPEIDRVVYVLRKKKYPAAMAKAG